MGQKAALVNEAAMKASMHKVYDAWWDQNEPKVVDVVTKAAGAAIKGGVALAAEGAKASLNVAVPCAGRILGPAIDGIADRSTDQSVTHCNPKMEACAKRTVASTRTVGHKSIDQCSSSFCLKNRVVKE